MTGSDPAVRVAEGLVRRQSGAVAIASDVAQRLRALFEQARIAWPAIDLPDTVYLDEIGARLSEEDDVLAALNGIHGSDIYLAVACAAHHPKALAEFETRYVAEVPRALSRLAPSVDFVQEVQQALRERLLVPQGEQRARIAAYSGRGPLGAWVRVAAVRIALSVRRSQKEALTPGGGAPDQPAAITDPAIAALRRQYKDVLKSAVQSALGSLPEDEKALLRQHVLDGLTVEQLGEKHGVHGSTISRRIARSRTAVLDETRRLLAREKRLRESEFKSLVRALRTDLDVSIRRILGKPSR